MESRLILQVAGKTDVGLVREHNEDYYAIDEKQGLFIVADGLGGHEAGEIASKLTVETILNFFRSFSDEELKGANINDKMNQAIQNAHHAIIDSTQQNPSLQGMGTTVVFAFWQPPNSFYIANIGDSRAYLLRNQKLELLTQDHSVVAQLVQEGKMTSEEARTYRLRNIVTQSIGIDLGMGCYHKHLALEEEDVVILCSDGLWDMLVDKEIEGILFKENSPEKICFHLVKAAKQAGGKDNITVIVIAVKSRQKSLARVAQAQLEDESN